MPNSSTPFAGDVEAASSTGSVTFKIITGPASNTAPKGLTLFKAVTYV